jgi:hypothetical protein
VATKNGIQGILYLTKLPKLLVDNPTENANKIEKQKEKNNK